MTNNTMGKVEFYSQDYNASNWEKFSSCFEELKDIEGEYNKIPSDILKVILGLLGESSGKNWCKKELNQLESKTVFDLVKSELGTRALKAFLMRMPN